MKKSLADRIEEYLKVLIERSEENKIEIQRSELAETFNCAPSQVTYVISTRFTIEEGYHTESRRGGKGFMRIVRIEDDLNRAALINQKDLLTFIDQLLESRVIGEEENEMLKYLITCAVKDIPAEQQYKFYEVFKYALSSFFKS